MARFPIVQTLMLGGALTFGSPGVSGHSLGLDYTTEWQTSFDGGYNWLNLLRASAHIDLRGGLALEAATISAAETRATPLVDDLLVYSNIAAGNIALTFARLGVAFNLPSTELFVGISNVNEDYFTSPLTAFFTNSSCGISPTIACNYDIANYPLASWCLHGSQRLGDFTLQTSLYPGRAYSRIAGHDNIFSLKLRRDGIFSITSLDYTRNDVYCVFGIALHYGMRPGDVVAEPTAPPQGKTFSAAPWLLGEISLPLRLGLLLHASCSTIDEGCKGYGGVGVVYRGEKASPGLSLNYAAFSDTAEFAAELTCRVPLLSGRANLQPALHLIATRHRPAKCVGLLRFEVSL